MEYLPIYNVNFVGSINNFVFYFMSITNKVKFPPAKLMKLGTKIIPYFKRYSIYLNQNKFCLLGTSTICNVTIILSSTLTHERPIIQISALK